MTEADRRSNLGRGLAALLGEEPESLAGLDDGRPSKEVPVEQLHPNRWQPRQAFDETATRELADSIRENGLLQPILVRRHPGRPGAFEIVAGERRWRAAQIAKLHQVPILIRDLSDVQTVELALVENLQREDLNPLEEAGAYQRLVEEFGHSQEVLARAVGKSRSHVANTLRLLSLPDPVKALLGDGRLSAGHARAILGVNDPEAAARQVVAEGLNVRQTEELAKLEKPAKSASGARGSARPATGARAGKDPDTAALERDLSALLGLKVTIDFNADGSGRLSIRYRTVEQLDDLLNRLDHARR